MMQGRLAQTLKDHFSFIHHIQVAGVPGRNDRTSRRRSISPFCFLFWMDGYAGWVGCEYRPRTQVPKRASPGQRPGDQLAWVSK